MKNPKLKHELNLKRIFIRCVALLFVIYALADISVLQVYCGNEAVGIPLSLHVTKDKVYAAEDSQNNFQQSREQKDSEQDCGDDCCFCCSSLVIVSYFAIASNVIKLTGTKTQSISYENKHPNSELRNLFRPPQIA